jgi:hypothetical protein
MARRLINPRLFLATSAAGLVNIMLHATLGLAVRSVPTVIALTMFAFHVATTSMILITLKIVHHGGDDLDDDQPMIRHLDRLMTDKPAGDFYKIPEELIARMPTTPCTPYVYSS